MVDWSAVFDEGQPRAGASDAEIARFVASVGHPLSDAEAATVNLWVQNQSPWPPNAPVYAADPSRWPIPNGPLPLSYVSFLRWSNGGEFRKGARRLQFFPALDPSHGVRAMLLAYFLPVWMPLAMPFAFNGGGTFYLFDMRRDAVGGEYPVVCSHSQNVGWGQKEFIQIADSFEAACRSTVNVDLMV